METSTQTYVNPLSDAGFKALLERPGEQAGSHRPAERVPTRGEARVGLGIRHHRNPRGDALEQGFAGGPVLH